MVNKSRSRDNDGCLLRAILYTPLNGSFPTNEGVYVRRTALARQTGDCAHIERSNDVMFS